MLGWSEQPRVGGVEVGGGHRRVGLLGWRVDARCRVRIPTIDHGRPNVDSALLSAMAPRDAALLRE